jgi:hypothetical protein
MYLNVNMNNAIGNIWGWKKKFQFKILFNQKMEPI